VRTRSTIFAAIFLLALALLFAAWPPSSVGATRIITRESARKLVAIPPSGGRPRALFQLSKGALLSIAASYNGKDIAFASRSWDKSTGIPVWTDRIWIKHGDRRPRAIRSFVSSGRSRAYKPIDSIALSPDGRRVLVAKRHRTVFIMRADGSGIHQVHVPGYTFGVGSGRNSSGPEFTPDGRRIVGTFYPPGYREDAMGGIGTTSLDGGRVHFLRRGPFSNGAGTFFAPTISRDGRLIAFVTLVRSEKSGNRLQIMVMNRNGTNAHLLRDSRLPAWSIANPCFSPSGKALSFVGIKASGGNFVIGVSPSAIFTIRIDGTHRREVQHETEHRVSRNPTWTHWPDPVSGIQLTSDRGDGEATRYPPAEQR
jgi:Tol biopolymer transport system component